MWWSYEDQRERKEDVKREILKRRKRGEVIEPLSVPAARAKLSTTFWGQAWGRNLESYQQYENRLSRGRSYLRQGHVYNLVIEPGLVSAIVAGSDLYDTKVHIKPLTHQHWQEIVSHCSGKVGSMLDLLAGKLGDDLMGVLTDPDEGLFPKPKEIRFDCSCPDHADMCKHVSAVLYGVGVMLDEQPGLLFALRGVDQAELLSEAGTKAVAGIGDQAMPDELSGVDLSSLFGIDLTESITADPVSEEKDPAVPTKKVRRKTKSPAKKNRAL